MKKIFKNPITQIILVALFVIIICVTVLFIRMSTDKLTNDYPNLSFYNKYEVIDAKFAKELVSSSNSYILVMGFSSCPWCQQLIPQIDAVAKELKYAPVYYLDIKDMRDNLESSDRDSYLAIKDFATVALDTVNDRISAPTVIFVKEGKIEDYHRGTISGHTLAEDKSLRLLTEEEILDLRKILKEKFEKVK